LKIAAWLVAQGARNVALLGRSGASDAALKMISEMETGGAKILVLQADVAHAEQLSNALATVVQTMPPLGGIVHAAGVLDDGLMTQQSWARFESVLMPKVTGAWNLHKLTAAQPLDFFVLFSSSAALLGGSGQGAYAAANSYLDALAYYRRSRGLPAVSINWGAWAEVGMAADLTPQLQAQREAWGHGQIRPEQGLKILMGILQGNETNVAVLPIRWAKYLGQLAIVPPFFANLEDRESTSIPTYHPSFEPVDGLQPTQHTPPQERRALLVAQIRSKIARALGAKETQLETDCSLFQLGVDSLMALELRNRLTSDLGVDVPVARFMVGPTIAEIADLLLSAEQELALQRAPTVEQPASDEKDPRDWSFLVPVCVVGAKPAFFWVHGDDSYGFLPRYLGSDQPLYGLVHQSQDGTPARYTEVDTIAASYLKEIRTVQAEGPYYLGGFSFGGIIAFEMAQQLKKQGQEVAFLFLLDSQFPGADISDPALQSRDPRPVRDEIYRHLHNLTKLGFQERLTYVLVRGWEQINGRTLGIRNSFKKLICKFNLTMGRGIPIALRSFYILGIYRQALRNYAPQRYAGAMFYVKCEMRSSEHRLAWSRLITGDMEFCEVSGGHEDLVKEPYVHAWAVKLRSWLDKARAMRNGADHSVGNKRQGPQQPVRQSQDERLTTTATGRSTGSDF
jgi:thioesterase domain-containing protein/aryl carrier-like protein